MTRWWIDVVAGVTDVLGVPLAALAVLLVGVLTGVLLATWPAWLPTRLPRRPGWTRAAWWRRVAAWRPRRRRRRRSSPLVEPPEAVDLPADQLPDAPAAAFTSQADRLAAEGRYAEAVRERMRAMVRDLVDRRVVGNAPGWTLTELAAAAATARPDVGPSVSTASGIFSDLWYGLRPAGREHDERMRALAGELTGTLGPAPGDRGGMPAPTVGIPGGHR